MNSRVGVENNGPRRSRQQPQPVTRRRHELLGSLVSVQACAYMAVPELTSEVIR